MNQHLKFWNEQLAFLKGRKIVDAYMDTHTGVDNGKDGVPVLVLDDGCRFLILADEEGNGPGSFVFQEPEGGNPRRR